MEIGKEETGVSLILGDWGLGIQNRKFEIRDSS